MLNDQIVWIAVCLIGQTTRGGKKSEQFPVIKSNYNILQVVMQLHMDELKCPFKG